MEWGDDNSVGIGMQCRAFECNGGFIVDVHFYFVHNLNCKVKIKYVLMSTVDSSPELLGRGNIALLSTYTSRRAKPIQTLGSAQQSSAQVRIEPRSRVLFIQKDNRLNQYK